VHSTPLDIRSLLAEAIADQMANACGMDVSETAHKGVRTAKDMADWTATWEAPLSMTYHGWTVYKTNTWSQGPVLWQALQILKGFDLSAMGSHGADFVHLVPEVMKLAYADREAYYGDRDHFDIPVDTLLSKDYAATRRTLVLSRLRFGHSTHLCGLSFKCQGAFPAERRVPPSWIIEPIDILEYSPFRLASCFPTIAPDELRLDGFEEREEDQERPQWGVSPTQDHAIVIAITFAAHRHFEAELFQAFLVVM
jgi:hypothetical protein